jgi:hypothetical protein
MYRIVLRPCSRLDILRSMDGAAHNDTVQLREMAERAFQLASRATDQTARDALLFYGQELLAKAKKAETENKRSD